MNTATQKIVDRIEKLRRLSTSSNVHEAAAAAAEAQRLMAAHHIAEAQLEAEGAEFDETVTSFDVLSDAGANAKTPKNWFVELARGVAYSNGCRLLITRARYGRAGKIELYGRTNKVQACNYLFQMFRKEINRLTAEFKAPTLSATYSFKYGAACEISARMQAESKAASDALKAAAGFGSAGASGALIVIDKEALAVMAAVKAAGAKGTFKIGGASDRDAFAAGRRAGASVNLGGNRPAIGAGALRLGAVR